MISRRGFEASALAAFGLVALAQILTGPQLAERGAGASPPPEAPLVALTLLTLIFGELAWRRYARQDLT
jgi:hypothetical protein